MYRRENKRKFHDKRRHNEEIMNYDTILNMDKLLTENEYKEIIKDENYENYFIKYHNIKIRSIFNRYREIDWFKERYISAMDNTVIYNNFDKFKTIILEKFKPLNFETDITEPFYDYDKNILLINNVPDSYNKRDIEEKIHMKVDSVIGLSRNNLKMNYSAILNENYSEEKIKNIMEGNLPETTYNIVKFEKLFIRRSGTPLHQSDLKNLKDIYNLLCSIYRVNIDISSLEEKMKDNLVDFYIYLLRFVFYFCYYCVRKHDTFLDLIGRCGDFHLRGGFSGRPLLERKYNLILYKNILNYLEAYNEDEELSAYVEDNGEEVGCGCCVKIFRSKEFVIKHLKQKHPELMENINNKTIQYEIFMKNIDLFLLLFVKGLSDNRLPQFINLEDSTQVRYDLPFIFSGDIVFE